MTIHKIKKYRDFLSSSYLVSLLFPILLLLLWELASQAGLIRATILPAPSRVFLTGLDVIADGSLTHNIWVSLLRVIQGYIFGALFGIVLGVLMGLSPVIRNALSLLTNVLRPIPIIAWVPVLILWMGIDEASKVTVIAIGTFWPVLISVIDGIRNVDQKYLEVAHIFMKSKLIVLTRVILPASLPTIFTGLRVGVGTAWMSVIGAELIAASAGLGYMISYARELSQPDNMLVGVFAIGIIGLLINVLLRMVEKRMLKWNVNLK